MPESLRRRTATGHVPGEPRHSTQEAQRPRVAVVLPSPQSAGDTTSIFGALGALPEVRLDSTQVARQSLPVASPSISFELPSSEALRECAALFDELESTAEMQAPRTRDANQKIANEVQNLIPLVLEVKEGVLVRDLSRRPGMNFLGNILDQEGNLKPRGGNNNAAAFHRKLDAIRTSHPQVVQDFEQAIGRAAAPRRQVLRSQTPRELEQIASEVQSLIPLAREVRAGTALSAISKRVGMTSFGQIFDSEGNLKSSEANASAKAFHRKLDAIRTSHPQVVQDFEQVIGQAAAPRLQRQRELEQIASEVQNLIPLVLQIKAGVSVNQISMQQGVMPSFRLIFDPDGTLKPSGANNNAAAFHRKLDKLRTSHPQVVQDFEQAIGRAAPAPAPRRQAPRELEQIASEVQNLIPLVFEVKGGELLNHVAMQEGITSSLRHIFDSEGNLRPSGANPSAKAFHHKLDKLRASHPQVVQDFEQAIRRAATPRRQTPRELEQIASEVQRLIPLVLEVKAGRLLNHVSMQQGITSSFRHIFDSDGNLKPSGANPSAKAFHRKLDAIRASHPQVVEALEQATNQAAEPRQSAADTFRVPASMPRAVPAQPPVRQPPRAGISSALPPSVRPEHVPTTWLRTGPGAGGAAPAHEISSQQRYPARLGISQPSTPVGQGLGAVDDGTAGRAQAEARFGLDLDLDFDFDFDFDFGLDAASPAGGQSVSGNQAQARGGSPTYSFLSDLNSVQQDLNEVPDDAPDEIDSGFARRTAAAPGSPTYSFLSDLNSVQQDLNEVPDDAPDEIDSGFAVSAQEPAHTPSAASLLLQAPERVESALAMVRLRGTSHDSAERAVGLPAGTLATLVDARGQWLGERAMAPLLDTLAPNDVQRFFNAIAEMRRRLDPPVGPAQQALQRAPDSDPGARDKGKARLPD